MILGEFSAGYFATVVVSSVVASVAGRMCLGNSPAINVPAYALEHPTELLLYVALGLLTAPAAVLFMKAPYRLEDAFEGMALPAWLKPAVGGAAVGAGILLMPEVAGVGYPAIGDALLGNLPLTTMAVLLLAKMVLTSFTLGSGGSGGIFAPSLFMGAMPGGAFGAIAHSFWPSETAAPGAYALVGMSVFFASVAHAPMTSVIMLFEMSNDCRLILPLMLATGVSTLFGQHLSRESIYTLKLVSRGVRLERGRDVDLLQGITVGEAMTQDLVVARTDWTLDRLADAFASTRHHGFPVADAPGRLIGIVTVHDVEAAAARADAGLHTGDIATRAVLVAYPDETVAASLRRMGSRDLGRLPVVARDEADRLLGVLRRQDVVRAYGQALQRPRSWSAWSRGRGCSRFRGTSLVEVRVVEGSPADGSTVAQLGLPQGCVLTAIYRDRGVLLPRGDTALAAGDRVTALVGEGVSAALAAAFGDTPVPVTPPPRQATH